MVRRLGGGEQGGLQRRLWRGLSLALWAAAGVRAGVGQGPAGTGVRGELRDEAGRLLRGTAVRLVSEDSGLARVAVSDGQGQFAVLGLDSGEYVCQVRPAMTPLWVGGLQLWAGGDAVQEVDLRLISQGSEVELRGTGDGLPLLPVAAGRTASVAGRVGQHHVGSALLGAGAVAGWSLTQQSAGSTELQLLPVTEDRMLADWGAAQNAEEGNDGASAREEGEAGLRAEGASAGGNSEQEAGQFGEGGLGEWGLSGGTRGGGGVQVSSGFGAGGVGRLRAVRRSFSAQTGVFAVGAGGGALGALGAGARSRAGVHGDGFFQARESAWAAVNPFAVVTSFGTAGVSSARVRPADSLLHFGAAVSGAVRVPGLGERWRLGMFGAVQGTERRQVLFSSPETPGFFQLSSGQRALLGNRGVGAAATAAALAYLSGMGGSEALPGSQWVGTGRVEVGPSARDRVSFGYGANRMDSPVTAGAQVADGVTSRAVGSVGTRSIAVDVGTVRWTHLFGPRWTNEVRGQAGRDVEAELPGPGSAAFPGLGPGGAAPQVSIGPQGFSYGTPAALGRVAYPDERQVGAEESSVWRFGRHLMTVGGEWRRLDDRVLGATNVEGSFLYDSGTTGGHAGGLVDWISDYTFNVHAYPNGACPSVTAAVHYFCFRSYSQSFSNAEAEFVTHEVAGFGEDAMRLGRGLRLTLGARWEYQLLPFPLLPNAALDAALAAAGVGSVGSTASFPEDRNNVGPRVGMSWSPGGGGGRGRAAWFTVQAGYGMFFGRMPGATLDAALTETGMAQATTRIRITPTVETDCPEAAGQGFGYPCAFEYAPLGVAPVAQTRSVVLFARRFRLPVVQQGRFAVERTLGGRVSVRAAYAAAWATQLPETTDLNIAPATGTVSYVVEGGDRWPGLRTGQSFRVPEYTARRSAQFGPATEVESNANATYHSGLAEATLRPWHGWGARGSVTYSKAMDYGPQVGATPRQDGQFDPFTDGYDKGRSSQDRPWEVAGAVSYRSSWQSGGEWGRRLLAGWGLSAAGTAGSGAPYSYVVFGGTRLPGGHESINGSGGATYLPTVGRNTLRLPMRSKVDLRTSKEVEVGARCRLEVQADAFNLLNTVSVSRVETRAFLLGTAGSVGGMTPLVFQDAATVAADGIATPAFGAPLSSTTGLSRERTVEMGARLRF